MMLTTHSMEEAEGLCDRLSIFVAGRLKTIGASAELKDRYGKYYKIQITTDLEHELAAKKHLEKIAPGVEIINTLAGTATYEVSRDAVKLHEVFRSLESRKDELKIRDWGISNTSTFLSIFLCASLCLQRNHTSSGGSFLEDHNERRCRRGRCRCQSAIVRLLWKEEETCCSQLKRG